MLELKNVNYFREKRYIIENFSYKFQRGKFYGLLGPNGAGKSTLLDLIIGHKELSNGEIFFDENPLRKFSHKDLGKKISLVPQVFDTHFSYTAREILEMGRFPYEKSSLDSDVGYEIIEKFTKLFNIEKLLSKPINEMSSGERQRILFIKALVQDTEFILLDEATANLDLFHTYNLLEELRREMLGTNKGVIAVFHDINLAATYCDEIIMLREGKIVVSGLKDEILSPKNIEDVFSVQSKILNCDGEKIIFSYLDK